MQSAGNSVPRDEQVVRIGANMETTTVSTDPQGNSDIERAIKRIMARGAEYKLYSDYYAGIHKQAYMSQEYLNDYGAMFRGLRVNMCPRVVDALVDRLVVTGFGVEDDGPKKQPKPRPIPVPMPAPTPPPAANVPPTPVQQPTAGATVPTPIPQPPPRPALSIVPPPEPIPETEGDKAWKLWQENRMDRRAGEAHNEAAKTGDAYLIVWPAKDDPSRPIIYVNKAAIMTVYYDEEEPGRILWAAKVWLTDDKYTRVTMYYPDRIEKWISANKSQANTPTKASSYVHYTAGGDGESWRIPNEYGKVPVFHLANNAGCGELGNSELKDVLPIQDALNKAFADKMVSMEFDAFRQRWITGLDVKLDPDTGKPDRLFRPGRDKIWATDSKETTFGEFTAGDPTKFNDMENGLIVNIARVSATPMHYINPQSGTPPSGEALRTAESPLIAKIDDRHGAWGNVWEDVMLFALQIAGVKTEGVQLEAQWKPAAVKSRMEKIGEATALLAMGIPEEQVWSELEYSQSDIEEWLFAKEQRKAEMAAKMQASAVPGQPGAPNNASGEAPPMVRLTESAHLG